MPRFFVVTPRSPVFIWRQTDTQESATGTARPRPKFYVVSRRRVGNYGYVPVGAASGTIIGVPLGSLALTGYAPTVSASSGTTIAIPAGSLTLTGYAPVVVNPRTISIPAGGLTLTGYAPVVSDGAGITISVPSATLTLTGYAPAVSIESMWRTVSASGGVWVDASSASGTWTEV